MEIVMTIAGEDERYKEREALHIRPYSSYNACEARPRRISAIVARGLNSEIGRGGDLPWRLREDLQHFKALTMGHPVIMGRRTWESLPKRPLPGRRNIVVSRQDNYQAEGAEAFPGIAAALAACAPDEEPFIIGGAEIYRSSLPYVTDLYLTEVEMKVEDADTWFPELDLKEWDEAESGERLVSANGIAYRFKHLQRL